MDIRYENKFQQGDVIRRLTDNKIFYVAEVFLKHDIDTSGRFDEDYYWSEYQCYNSEDDKIETIMSYDNYRFELIAHRFIYEDVKPFMQVLVLVDDLWVADFVTSHNAYQIQTLGHGSFEYRNVVPYNDYTKHLYGTNIFNTKSGYHNCCDIATFNEHYLEFIE